MQDRKEEIRQSLSGAGLKVTPQRVTILETIYSLKNHPTAENIIREVRKNHSNIASGTVYKVLDALEKNNLIKTVTTNKGVSRYDGVTENHHHLYCTESDLIQDYFDKELDNLLEEYFRRKKIEGFQIEEMILEIKGKYIND